MRKAGRLAAETLDLLVPMVQPGVTTEHLDTVAFEHIVANGAYPAPLNYRGFRKTICTSINHVVLPWHSGPKGTQGRRYRQY